MKNNTSASCLHRIVCPKQTLENCYSISHQRKRFAKNGYMYSSGKMVYISKTDKSRPIKHVHVYFKIQLYRNLMKNTNNKLSNKVKFIDQTFAYMYIKIYICILHAMFHK